MKPSGERGRKGCGFTGTADSIPNFGRRRVFLEGLGARGEARDVAAGSVRASIRTGFGTDWRPDRSRSSPRTTRHSQRSKSAWAATTSPLIPNGTGGLEERLAVLWTEGVETGRLTPNEFVAATSTNIARILNIYPKKGAMLQGADADIVVWDPKLSKTITATTHKSVLDYNVFEGFEVKAQARYTLSRGRSDLGLGEELAAESGTRKVHSETGVPFGSRSALEMESAQQPPEDRKGSAQHSCRNMTRLAPRECSMQRIRSG